MRALPLLLLIALPASSQETQVDWVGDWEQAFGQAREQKKPVMICINSKDGERASDQAKGEDRPSYGQTRGQQVKYRYCLHRLYPFSSCRISSLGVRWYSIAFVPVVRPAWASF